MEDVTSMSLSFHQGSLGHHSQQLAGSAQSREMTIVGSKRMIVYDDVAQQEKIRIFDARVERPPHYDTFAEFHYAYHYGDTYAPYLKQEEPLKTECQHFLDCIQQGKEPLTSGEPGLGIGQDPGGLLRILEAGRQSGGLDPRRSRANPPRRRPGESNGRNARQRPPIRLPATPPCRSRLSSIASQTRLQRLMRTALPADRART